LNTIGRLRQAADLLLSEGRYNEAYTVYDELYRQMWTVFGTVQASLASTAGGGFGNAPQVPGSRRVYAEPIAGVLCARMYGTTLSQVLEEFQRILFGHLQCICSSRELCVQSTNDSVLNEFAVFFVLALQPARARKITPVFAIVTAVLDKERRLRRVKSNYLRRDVEKYIVESAEQCKNGDWKDVNSLLLSYLDLTAQTSTDLYSRVLRIAGPRWDRSRQRPNAAGDSGSGNRKEQNDQRNLFDPATASEREKKAYYGKLLGLTGVLTKSEVRSRYISTVALYHPDKVQHLGKELRDLAEEKTKEFNAAYEWLKSKYKI
jgi:hypothetical protein